MVSSLSHCLRRRQIIDHCGIEIGYWVARKVDKGHCLISQILKTSLLICIIFFGHNSAAYFPNTSNVVVNCLIICAK